MRELLRVRTVTKFKQGNLAKVEMVVTMRLHCDVNLRKKNTQGGNKILNKFFIFYFLGACLYQNGIKQKTEFQVIVKAFLPEEKFDVISMFQNFFKKNEGRELSVNLPMLLNKLNEEPLNILNT